MSAEAGQLVCWYFRSSCCVCSLQDAEATQHYSLQTVTMLTQHGLGIPSASAENTSMP